MKKSADSKSLLLYFFLVSSCLISFGQDDDFEDFDPSMFEEAGTATKSFCANKILGQQPTPLISVGFDYQGASDVNTAAFSDYTSGQSEIGFNSGFRFVSNIPILSRNNILINWGISYVQMSYSFSNDNVVNPLSETLRNHSLKWLYTT